MNAPPDKSSTEEPLDSDDSQARLPDDRRVYTVHGARSRISFAIHLGAIAFLAIRLVPVWNRFGYIVHYESDTYESPGTGFALLLAALCWLVAVESSLRPPTRQYYGVFERSFLGISLVFMLVVLFYFCEFLMFINLGPSS